jgi:hypothetical protein
MASPGPPIHVGAPPWAPPWAWPGSDDPSDWRVACVLDVASARTAASLRLGLLERDEGSLLSPLPSLTSEADQLDAAEQRWRPAHRGSLLSLGSPGGSAAELGELQEDASLILSPHEQPATGWAAEEVSSSSRWPLAQPVDLRLRVRMPLARPGS